MKAYPIFIAAIFSFIFNRTDLSGQENLFAGFETDTFITSSKRFEIVPFIGYSSINNLTGNDKTTVFKQYNAELQDALNTGLYLGYNVTHNFSIGAKYTYRSSQNSELYRITYSPDSVELLAMSDEYRFHQVGLQFAYRLNVLYNNLFITPGAGFSYVAFNNKANKNGAYTQKSTGFSLDTNIGLEYYLTNHIGIALHYNFSLVELDNTSIDYEVEDAQSIMPDTRFNFSDISFRLIWVL